MEYYHIGMSVAMEKWINSYVEKKTHLPGKFAIEQGKKKKNSKKKRV